jgi:8-oxo-dGTP pyrophosphatase MutT (NUDIX family)
MPIFDVFQKGLLRGAEHLSYDPTKAYAYVEHPTEGWRVYLRGAAFLHEDPLQLDRFMVFRNSKHKRSHKNIWEPPKGQMEGKDLLRHPKEPLLRLMTNSIRREVEEEAHVTDIKEIKYTGLVFQSQEASYPKNWFFQYHLFQMIITTNTVEDVFDTFAWMEEHPKAVARWRRDRRETDRVAWFEPKETPLNPRWCPTIVYAYLKTYDQQQIQIVK